MDARRKQFVRMVDQALDILRQVRSAGSLAPDRLLGERLAGMVDELVRLRDDDSLWVFGRDRSGRVVSESGQILEVDDEG